MDTIWTITPPTALAVVEHLDLKNAVHIGHSTGGGEVARYVAQHGEPQGRVAKAVLISAVPPLMVKTSSNPERVCQSTYSTGSGRGRWLTIALSSLVDVPTGPFYGFNRVGRGGATRCYPKLVAPGNDGQREGALRLHRGVLGN